MTAIWRSIKQAAAATNPLQHIISWGVCALLVSIGLAARVDAAPSKDLNEFSTTQLEARRDTIDDELTKLAHLSLRNGMGAIGYRSKPHPTPEHTEWVQINMADNHPLERIILVPAIWNDPQSGYRDDGFPVEFRILAGTKRDTTGTVIATFKEEDQLVPRIAPLIVPCAVTAAWVRVEATVLSPRSFDGKYNLELSEIMLFNGEENLALSQPVSTSFNPHQLDRALKAEFLTDGFTPYQMHSGQGERSIAFINQNESGQPFAVTLDLKKTHPLSRIHLHTVELSDTIPQSIPVGFGIPPHLLVEGAIRADFSDAILLADCRFDSAFDVGPIIIRTFPETHCRYVRLTSLESYIDYKQKLTGFAEIELFSKGQNVALNQLATSNYPEQSSSRKIQTLTDGQNINGQIISIRQWMEQLAHRHELEVERPRIEAELKLRYARQKTNFNRLLWLLALLVISLLVNRMNRQRAIHRSRQQIAADLHDELGADLHALGLLSDLAQKTNIAPEKLHKLLQLIRSFTQSTGAAARYCTNMLEAKEIFQDVPAHMRRVSERMLTDFKYDISFQGEAHLRTLSARKRIDLCLFHKECLTNILRHSGATEVSIKCAANKQRVELVISDNGRGLNSTDPADIPKSIKRRNRLLGSQVRYETPATGGTRITLTLNLRKLGII